MQARNNANRQCSFCRSGDHNIRKCHSNEAHDLHRFINETLFDMPCTQQVTTLHNNYGTREIKMISVILDLQLFSRKSEMIDNIVLCLFDKKTIIMALLALERVVNRTNKIIVNTIALEENSENETIDCPICFNTHSVEETFKTNCNHSFCIECMKNHLRTDAQCKCPMCRTKVTMLDLKQINPSNEVLGQHEYNL
jgi:hypothetical protein